MSIRVEQTITSIEAAEMLEKTHANLMKDIRRYAGQLAEVKIDLGDFFQENTYTDANNQTRPCYQITKKGCEFIAHKLTGTKGTAFTARYINRFHEMEDIVTGKQSQKEPNPWYIREFRGRKIILYRDFEQLTGINPRTYGYWNRPRIIRLIPGVDFNGWGWKCNNEEFKKEYGFDYGTDDLMMYLTMSGFIKSINFLKEEGNKSERELAIQLLPETCTHKKRKETK